MIAAETLKRQLRLPFFMGVRMSADGPEQGVIDGYADALWMEKGLSENSLSSYRLDLKQFSLWLDGRGSRLLAASGVDIREYLAFRLEKKLSARSTARLLSCLRGFYQLQLPCIN